MVDGWPDPRVNHRPSEVPLGVGGHGEDMGIEVEEKDVLVLQTLCTSDHGCKPEDHAAAPVARDILSGSVVRIPSGRTSSRQQFVGRHQRCCVTPGVARYRRRPRIPTHP